MMGGVSIGILLGAPLTDQNFERTGISSLSKQFRVVVLDCTEWLGRNTAEIKSKRAEWEDFVSIKSLKDFLDAIHKFNIKYAIDFIGPSEYLIEIYKVFKVKNIKLVIQKTGNLPKVSFYVRLKYFLLNIASKNLICYSNLSSKEIKNFVPVNKNSILKKALEKSKISFSLWKMNKCIGLIAGNRGLNKFTRRFEKILWVASNDYHIFFREKNKIRSEPLINKAEPFILFIDDAISEADDWILLNATPPVTQKIYYIALNNYFDRIESLFGMPIRVAGHPNKAADSNYQDKMGNRLVFFGKTAELAMTSSLVLTHGSTAISFAVLARKPIVFMVTKESCKTLYGEQIKAMSRELGAPLICIDGNNNKNFESKALIIKKNKYKKYEINYLCNNLSYETAQWQSLIEYINNRR